MNKKGDFIVIEQISFLPKKPVVALTDKQETGAAQLAGSFGTFLNDAITNLNKQHSALNTLNDKFVTGEVADVHQLTIAAEKLSLGLEMTVQIRNKAVEAYQEIMRTQI